MKSKQQVVSDVYRAVDAIAARNDPDGASRNLATMLADDGRLVIDVLVDLIKRLISTNPDVNLPVTALLPEPSQATELLRAVTNDDADALSRLANGEYAELISLLLCLSAALVTAIDAAH